MPEINVQSSSVSPEQIQEIIVLALMHSKLKDSMSKDLFVLVLEEHWHEMTAKKDVLLLQPIIDTLKGQGGFKLDDAIPPLCRVKTLEGHLKVVVELPKEFTQKGIFNPASWAAGCKIPDKLLLKALPAIAMSATRLAPIVDKPQVTQKEEEPSKLPMIAAALVLLLAAGGGGGFFLWTKMRSVEIDVNAVADMIPLASAQKSGDEVTAVLKEPTWLTFSKADRTEHVQSAFDKVLKLEGVAGFKLVDKNGKVLATARGKPTPVIKLME